MSSPALAPAPAQRPVARRLLRAATALTTPLLPDDYLTYLNPLWSTREPRGRVDAVIPETADSATIWLRVGPDWPRHTPGQYVRIGVDIDGVRHWRTYSLTSVPGRDDHRIAITVKAVADGFVSRHLVHATKRGTVVRLAPPTGEFVLPAARPRRLLFVTAGSGITPAMGMLRHLQAQGDVDGVTHVHLAPSRDDVIFGEELRRLERAHDGFTLHEHHDDRDGIFSPARLQTLVPDWHEHDTWACGPAGLLDALTEVYAGTGAGEKLNIERFRPVLAAAAQGTGGTITFTKSKRTVEADAATPLLVAGEQAGALLPSGCRMGICNSCVGRLCRGAVRDLRTGELQDTPDMLVRTCTSTAAGDVEIDL